MTAIPDSFAHLHRSLRRQRRGHLEDAMDTLQHDTATESMAQPVLEPAARKRSTEHMKKLFSGVAIIAALAIAAPASAQRTGPGPEASTTTGPGVTPPGGFGPSSP